MSLLVSGLSTVFAVAGFGGSMYGLLKGYNPKKDGDGDMAMAVLIGACAGAGLSFLAGQGLGNMIEGVYTFRDEAAATLCKSQAEDGKPREFRINADGSTSCFINGKGLSSSKSLTP